MTEFHIVPSGTGRRATDRPPEPEQDTQGMGYWCLGVLVAGLILGFLFGLNA